MTASLPGEGEARRTPGGGNAWRRLAALLLGAICLCLALPAHADRPSGVSAQTVVLPSGPGSLKGLGESFEPNAATGAGGYSVPIAVPPGFLAPTLSISYSGGWGKGVLGQGWSLATLQIYRQTDKGAPKFDESDRFCVAGGDLNGELVLVNETLHYYRLKNEGLFALFIRDPDNDSWTIRRGSGETSYLGESSESRETARGRSARWFLDKHADRFGHWTEYHYFTDHGHVYLDEVAYQLHAAPAYQNTLSFNYEERPDVFTDYTYGDANTTAQRLASVQAFHGARLVRSYRVGYEAGLLFSVLTSVDLTGEDGLRTPTLSFEYLRDTTEGGELVNVKNVPPLDALVEGWGDLDDVNADGLPDVLTTRAGDYRYYENVDGRSFGNVRTLKNSPDHDLGEDGVVFADIDGDGFRDLVHPQGDHFRYYPGGDIKNGVLLGYRPAVELKSLSDAFTFTSPELKLGDQNHDGRIDLLWQKPGNDSWLINGKDNVLREQATKELPADLDFEDSRLELTDFNGDGLLDGVRKDIGLNSSTVRVWFGLGHGEFTGETQIPGVPKGDPAEFYLQDVNHDGQVDLLRISGSWATAYLNRGLLGFSGARGDFRGLPAARDTLKLLFADMNGNGTTDVVWITSDFKLRYLDLTGEPYAGLLSRIDNGMGLVTEIAYRSSTEYMVEDKAASKPWIHPLPLSVPVISEVRATDSLDLLGFKATETRTSYAYRDGYYDGKEREFRGFGEATVTSWGDAAHETLVTRTKFHVGRNAVTLADEEVLAGKPLAQMLSDVNGNLYSSSETAWEQLWLCQEAIGGEVAVLPRCQVMGDLAGKKDRLVALGVSSATLHATFEKTSKPRFALDTTDCDAWGHVSKTVHHGEVIYSGAYSPGQGLDLSRVQERPGDEQITTTVRLHDIGQWLIDLPIESRMVDVDGNILGRTRTYYDGLGYGKVGRGLTTRTAKYDIDRARWIDVERVEYDSHGNRAASVNAVGDRYELSYDSRSSFLPSQERASIGASDWLVWNAEHDLAHGKITRTTDPNGQVWTVDYDGLGRPIRSFEPGSSLPATRYEYSFGTPTNPVSVTRADRLVDAQQYHSTWTYADGAGHPRQVKETAEAPHGYIASGWVETSARGGTIADYQPFPSPNLGLELPPKGTPVTRLMLDSLGRALQTSPPPTAELPTGALTQVQYLPWETHAYSERESSLGDLSHPTKTRVDGLGRVIEIRKLNSHWEEQQELVWRVSYDARGAIATFADPAWNGNANDTRHLRRYSYDGLGRLSTIRDPNAGTASYERDDLDRVVKSIDALGQEQDWVYGPGGRLLSHKVGVDARGRASYEHKYHYDEPAPASPLEAPGNAHVRGKLSWIEFPVGEEHFGYDAQGRASEEAHVLWNPATSAFEQQQRDVFRHKIARRTDGLVTRATAPGGFELSFQYNERGKISRADAKWGQVGQGLLLDARYDQRGATISSDLGNGVRGCNSFNQRGELTVMAIAKKSQLNCEGVATASGGLHNLRYTHTYDGLITSVEDFSTQDPGVDRLDSAFEYDSIQQLVKVTDPRGTTSLRYDQIQNLVRRDVDAAVVDEPTGDFAYGENGAGPNALTSAGGTNYGYDVAGQMLRYNGYDLGFNAEGQLIEANNVSTGVRIVQHYDDAGERRLALVYRAGKPVEVHRFVAPDYQIHDGEEVWLVGAGLAQAEVVRSQGVKVDAYLLDELTKYVNGVRAGPKPLPAEYMDLNGDGVVMNSADLAVAQQGYTSGTRVGGEKLVWRFSTSDHLGTAVRVTDSVGDLVSFQRRHAYGKQAARAGQQPYRGGYLGKDTEVDLDLGLQRLGARYYAPALGRWISPDPLIGSSPARMLANVLESNLYSYALNNPIMVSDPSGLKGKGKGEPKVDIEGLKAINNTPAGEKLTGPTVNQLPAELSCFTMACHRELEQARTKEMPHMYITNSDAKPDRPEVQILKLYGSLFKGMGKGLAQLGVLAIGGPLYAGYCQVRTAYQLVTDPVGSLNAVKAGWDRFKKDPHYAAEVIGEVAGPLILFESLNALPRTLPKRGAPGTYTPNRELPTDNYGVPVPDADGPHTQLGRSKAKYGSEPQAREWGYGENGKLQPVKDIDFTDHGHPEIHPNPHEHKLTPNNKKLAPKGGFQRGDPEELQ